MRQVADRPSRQAWFEFCLEQPKNGVGSERFEASFMSANSDVCSECFEASFIGANSGVGSERFEASFMGARLFFLSQTTKKAALRTATASKI